MLRKEMRHMKKAFESLLKRKNILSAFMLAGGIVSVLAKYGCCFYIYHQPKYPEALRMAD